MDFDEAVGHVNEALRHNEEAAGRQKGVEDDTASAVSAFPTTDALAKVVEVIDNQIENARAAYTAAEEMITEIQAADETHHFQESENAHALAEHVRDTSEGQLQVLTEAKEAMMVALTRLDEAKLSLEQVHTAAGETIQSTGGVKENLDQLIQRLAG